MSTPDLPITTVLDECEGHDIGTLCSERSWLCALSFVGDSPLSRRVMRVGGLVICAAHSVRLSTRDDMHSRKPESTSRVRSAHMTCEHAWHDGHTRRRACLRVRVRLGEGRGNCEAMSSALREHLVGMPSRTQRNDLPISEPSSAARRLRLGESLVSVGGGHGWGCHLLASATISGTPSP